MKALLILAAFAFSSAAFAEEPVNPPVVEPAGVSCDHADASRGTFANFGLTKKAEGYSAVFSKWHLALVKSEDNALTCSFSPADARVFECTGKTATGSAVYVESRLLEETRVTGKATYLSILRALGKDSDGIQRRREPTHMVFSIGNCKAE